MIDQQLVLAGWLVQQADHADVSAGPGVAVREFILEKGHGRVDYLLFLNGQPVGVIEAKPKGTTLTEVEHLAGRPGSRYSSRSSAVVPTASAVTAW